MDSTSISRTLAAAIAERPDFAWITEGTGNVDRLTTQQVKVLWLLGIGQDNAAIAKALGRTERTAKLHVGEILRRLAVESRLQAGIIGFADILAGDRRRVSECGAAQLPRPGDLQSPGRETAQAWREEAATMSAITPFSS